MRSFVFLLASWVLVLPAAAQFGVGGDATFRSKHVWRGQTYRNGWVVQPSAFFYHAWPRVTTTAGVWTHGEASDVDVDDGVGYGRHWLGEVNLWADVSASLGPARVNAGWATYFIHNDAAMGPAGVRENTHEVYVGARLGRPRLTPHATLWYDADAVKGAFLETGLQYRLPVWTQVILPVGSLVLNATAGFSFGQEINHDDPDEVAYFERRGLTHVDVSLATTVGYIPIRSTNNAVHLALHVQVNRDERLKSVSRMVDAGERVKVWGGITWTILWPRCRPERDICSN